MPASRARHCRRCRARISHRLRVCALCRAVNPKPVDYLLILMLLAGLGALGLRWA